MPTGVPKIFRDLVIGDIVGEVSSPRSGRYVGLGMCEGDPAVPQVPEHDQVAGDLAGCLPYLTHLPI